MTDDLAMMRLLHHIAHATNSSLHLEETLHAILHAIQDTLDVHAVVIRLLNANADALAVAASVGLSQRFLDRLPARVTPGSVHERVLAGETVRVVDLVALADIDPVFASALLTDDVLRQERVGGFLAVPLQVRDRVLGSLNLYCTTGCGFTEPIVQVVQAAADLAAIAIDNARLHTALFRIAQALTSTLEIRPLLKQVLEATVMEMGLKAASVRLLDASGKKLELVAAHGLSDRYLAKGSIVVAKSLIDQRLLSGETVVLYDVAGEQGFQYPTDAASEGIRSVLAVPLRVKEKVVGVMRVYSVQPRHFTAVGIEFLQSAAGLVAVAIENAKLYQALQARYEGLKTDVSEWYRFLSLG